MKANNSFYFKFAVSLFLLAFCSFGINAVINPEMLPPSIPLVHVHAVCMFTWLGILPLQFQNTLIENKVTVKVFQMIGWVGVIGIVVTIFLMTAFKYQRNPDVTLDATFNLHTIINFMVFTCMAIYHHKSSINYQRLLLLSSVIIILPALKRLLRIFMLEENFAFLLLFILFIIFAVQELKHQKKIHRFTVLTVYLVVQSVVLSVLLSRFSFWKNSVDQMMFWIPIA